MSDLIDNIDDDLTDEERAALEYKGDEEAEKKEFDPDADPAPDPSEDQGAPAELEPEQAAEVETPAETEQKPAEEAALEAKPEPVKQEAAPAAPQQAPILIAQAPEDAQAKLDDIAKQRDALSQKFEDGDITSAQYQRELSELSDKQLDIKLQVERAHLAQQMESQRIQNQWVNDCNAFLVSHPEYADTTSERYKLLNETIMALATMPSNQGLSNDKALAKAHRMVQIELGEIQAPVAAPAPAKVVQHNIPKPPAPPNVGSLPAATMNDDTGGEFAALDRLGKSGDLEAYEAALDKLTEAQKARYFKN